MQPLVNVISVCTSGELRRERKCFGLMPMNDHESKEMWCKHRVIILTRGQIFWRTTLICNMGRLRSPERWYRHGG